MVVTFLATLSGWKFAVVISAMMALVALVVHLAFDAAENLAR